MWPGVGIQSLNGGLGDVRGPSKPVVLLQFIMRSHLVRPQVSPDTASYQSFETWVELSKAEGTTCLGWLCLLFYLFFLLVLWRYNRHTTLYKFKVYSIMTYIYPEMIRTVSLGNIHLLIWIQSQRKKNFPCNDDC